MLSDEEQKARAIEISKIYPAPGSRQSLTETVKEEFKLKPTVLATFLFSIPLIFANTLYDFYTLGKYTSTADVQAASIVFILLLFALFITFVVCFKACHTILYSNYSASSSIFWLSLVTISVVLPFFRLLISGQPGQALPELLIRSSIFMLVCMIVTALIFMLITKFTLKHSTKSS